MSKNIVLRDQIARDLSKELDISLVKSKMLILKLESIIAYELKSKSRIKIAHFGTFVIKTRASRTVKTVREQKTKIILEQEAIRFIAAEQFKSLLMCKPDSTNFKKIEPARPAETKSENSSEKISISVTKPSEPDNAQVQNEEIPVKFVAHEKSAETIKIPLEETPEPKKNESTKIIPIITQEKSPVEITTKPKTSEPAKTAPTPIRQPEPISKPRIVQLTEPVTHPAVSHAKTNPIPPAKKTVRPVEKIKFSPLSIYSRIERAKVETEIADRLVKLAKTLESQKNEKSDDREIKIAEKIFANFISKASKLHVKSLDFSISAKKPSKSDQTAICAGKPRVCLGKIPTLLLHQFTEEIADIENFETPQLRFVTIKKADNIKKAILEVHSFPTHDGASIHVKVL